MGATVSGPSITVDETAETITLTAGATIPTSFLRVFGCETMTVTAMAEVTRKIKALDVVPTIGMSGSIRRGAGEDGTGETIRFGDSADCIPDTPARWSPTVRKSLVFSTSRPVFNRGGFQLVRCPLWVRTGRSVDPRWMSAHSHNRTAAE